MKKLIILLLFLTSCTITTETGYFHTYKPTTIQYKKAKVKVKDGKIHIRDAEDVILYTDAVDEVVIEEIHNLKGE